MRERSEHELKFGGQTHNEELYKEGIYITEFLTLGLGHYDRALKDELDSYGLELLRFAEVPPEKLNPEELGKLRARIAVALGKLEQIKQDNAAYTNSEPYQEAKKFWQNCLHALEQWTEYLAETPGITPLPSELNAQRVKAFRVADAMLRTELSDTRRVDFSSQEYYDNTEYVEAVLRQLAETYPNAKLNAATDANKQEVFPEEPEQPELLTLAATLDKLAQQVGNKNAELARKLHFCAADLLHDAYIPSNETENTTLLSEAQALIAEAEEVVNKPITTDSHAETF